MQKTIAQQALKVQLVLTNGVGRKRFQSMSVLSSLINEVNDNYPKPIGVLQMMSIADLIYIDKQISSMYFVS
jgi:hypothetical protein